MNLTGSYVRFRLLPEGLDALQGVVPEIDFLEAFVLDEDEVGVWLSVPRFRPPNEAVLLKWHHFSTALTDYEPESPALGFKRETKG